VLRFLGADRSQTQIDDAGWKRLAAGRTLLIVHGTFDTVQGCFRRLPDSTLAELHKRYGGRVIGFDHSTLADSPIDNAQAFFGLVGDHALDVDIVCHSRGGLVTRAIAERPRELKSVGKNVRVGTAVLVGSTTNGTWLADIGHWNDLIDRISTLLSFAPVPAAVDVLETVFGLVRSLAVESDHRLAGLDAMAPTRPYLEEVNRAPALVPGGSYKAIASNYEPADPALKAFFTDQLKDNVIFKGPNDGMVGVDEVWGETIASPFPVTDTLEFGPADGIEHSNYFSQGKTTEALLDWLKG
jgi:pimeloyl-ACP methyl ester carboxylesterase